MHWIGHTFQILKDFLIQQYIYFTDLIHFILKCALFVKLTNFSNVKSGLLDKNGYSLSRVILSFIPLWIPQSDHT